MRARGGRLVVVDPRRSRTAEEADEHLAIRPGTDALLLLGDRQRAVRRRASSTLGAAVECTSDGLDEVRDARRGRSRPRRSARRAGDRCRRRSARLAHELAAAPTPPSTAASARPPPSSARSPSWLVDVAQHPHRQPRPAGRRHVPDAPPPAADDRAARPGSGSGVPDRARRTAGSAACPRCSGELPVACLADEIDDARRRAGPRARSPSPATRCCRRRTRTVSTRRSPALDFMVSDRHLPQRDHPARRRDPAAAVAAAARALRRRAAAASPCATWPTTRPPVLPLDDRPARRVGDRSPASPLRRRAAASTPTPPTVDDLAIAVAGAPRRSRRAVADPRPRRRRDPGDAARPGAAAPSAARLHAAHRPLRRRLRRPTPGGADARPHAPRPPARRRPRPARTAAARGPAHAVGSHRAGPRALVADVARLPPRRSSRSPRAVVLVGRRHLRSNNSWMHNIAVLVKGQPDARCRSTPTTRLQLGLVDGAYATVDEPRRQRFEHRSR